LGVVLAVVAASGMADPSGNGRAGGALPRAALLGGGVVGWAVGVALFAAAIL